MLPRLLEGNPIEFTSNNIAGILTSFKVVVNVAAETSRLTASTAALRVINIIPDYNKKSQLDLELSELNLHKFAVNEFFF
jgi:hypothetical protein